MANTPDTFPKILIENATKFADKAAIREKDFGIWQTWSWSMMRDEIFALANGLAAMGFKRGDKIAIVGRNRPRLYWSMCAAQCLGGIPVPVYQDSVADEIQYVLKKILITSCKKSIKALAKTSESSFIPPVQQVSRKAL